MFEFSIKFVISLVAFLLVFLDLISLSEQDEGSDNDKPGIKWTPGIESWTRPEDIVKDLPTYLSGFDYEGRPVLITEFGRWNLLKYLGDGNATKKEILYRRAEQLWWLCMNSTYNKVDGEEGSVTILDLSGFSPAQLVNKAAIEFNLWNMRMGEDCEECVGEFIIVNANFAVSSWIELIRPVAGKLVGRATVIGTDKTKISASLRQKVPLDQLPPWFGGPKNFEPKVII